MDDDAHAEDSLSGKTAWARAGVGGLNRVGRPGGKHYWAVWCALWGQKRGWGNQPGR